MAERPHSVSGSMGAASLSCRPLKAPGDPPGSYLCTSCFLHTAQSTLPAPESLEEVWKTSLSVQESGLFKSSWRQKKELVPVSFSILTAFRWHIGSHLYRLEYTQKCSSPSLPTVYTSQCRSLYLKGYLLCKTHTKSCLRFFSTHTWTSIFHI